jgi:hypothetical protein
MDGQLSFAALDYAGKKKRTKRDVFLGREPINLSGGRLARVRYAPITDKIARRSEMTRCAMCGRLRVGKSILHVCSVGRCSHVFGL